MRHHTKLALRRPVLFVARRAWVATLAVCLLSATAVTEAAAASLEGQTFDNRATLDGKPLALNGLGLRGVAWIKAFVAGIYVTSPSKDGAQLVAQAGPKRIRLKIMLGASAHELTKSLVGRIEDHESTDFQKRVMPRMNLLGGAIDSMGDLKAGDTVDLDWLPGKGTQLVRNGRAVGEPVPGDDLYGAVMRIFVGDHPVDKRMKKGLLAGGV
ncbi:MAG: hypothetical protein RI907_1061 [Pseudomonadota bacterium]|jgi:hypothetical protein